VKTRKMHNNKKKINLTINTRSRKPNANHESKEGAVNARRKSNCDTNKLTRQIQNKLKPFIGDGRYTSHLAARDLIVEFRNATMDMTLLQLESIVGPAWALQAKAMEDTVNSMPRKRWKELTQDQQISKFINAVSGDLVDPDWVKDVAFQLRKKDRKLARLARILLLQLAKKKNTVTSAIDVRKFPAIDKLRAATLDLLRDLSNIPALDDPNPNPNNVLDDGLKLLRTWLDTCPDWPAFTSLRERALAVLESAPRFQHTGAVALQRVGMSKKRKCASISGDSHPSRKRGRKASYDRGTAIKNVPYFECSLRDGAHAAQALIKLSVLSFGG